MEGAEVELVVIIILTANHRPCRATRGKGTMEDLKGKCTAVASRAPKAVTRWGLGVITGPHLVAISSSNSRNMAVGELTRMDFRRKVTSATAHRKTTHTCTSSSRFSSKTTCSRTHTPCRAAGARMTRATTLGSRWSISVNCLLISSSNNNNSVP